MDNSSESFKKMKFANRKLAIILEITLVLLPIFIGLALSEWSGNNFIRFSPNLVLLGGPFAYVGLGISLLILWFVSRIHNKNLRDFGLKHKKGWIKQVFKGLLVALVVFASVILIINPLINVLPDLSPRDMRRFEVLRGNFATLLINLVAMWITAGFLEEFFWRGYLMERLFNLFEHDSWSIRILVLLFSALIFGFAHFYQGGAGMIKTGLVGLVFGVSYLILGRDLWPLIIAHGLIDSIDFITHYLGG